MPERGVELPDPNEDRRGFRGPGTQQRDLVGLGKAHVIQVRQELGLVHRADLVVDQSVDEERVTQAGLLDSHVFFATAEPYCEEQLRVG